MPTPPKLLILDCDGVLIDSEAVAAKVTSGALQARGWDISPAECERRFIGRTFSDIALLAQPHTGWLGPDWVAETAAMVAELLQFESEPMPGAIAFIETLARAEINFRVASNSSHVEMKAKFTCSGLDRWIAPDRRHSAGDVMAKGGKPKPAPDLYLETAQIAGVAPADCWVIEDSVPGATAAIAAGMLCYGFQVGAENPALTRIGAVPLLALADLLPSLL